jgi:hypothetical protein
LAHREDDVGGTCRINTYPGLACDVKSRSARWEGETQRWCLTTSTGEQHQCRLQQRDLHARSAGTLLVRALKYMRRTGRTYVAVRPTALAEFVTKIDRWMTGTVWTTQCSNYFPAANGRVVTQWPRSARSFWEMTRRFKAADFSFSNAPAKAMAAVESGR